MKSLLLTFTLSLGLVFFGAGCEPKEKQAEEQQKQATMQQKKETGKKAVSKEEKATQPQTQTQAKQKPKTEVAEKAKKEAKKEGTKTPTAEGETEDKAKKEVKKEGTKTPTAEGKTKRTIDPKDKVPVVFHVMSLCPYGIQVLQGIKPVLEKIGKYIDFKVEYIGTVSGDKLSSMHGDKELKGDVVQLCAQKHSVDKFMDMIDCMNNDRRNIPDNWEKCAKQAGMDDATVSKIKACYEGDEGKQLTKASFEESQKKGARGSPTMFIAGKKYMGGRTERDFMREICSHIKDKPEPCLNIPEPPKVNLIVINDKRCKERFCNTNRMTGGLKSLFPGLQITKYDWSQDEAKKIYEEEGLQFLPALLFDSTVEKEKAGYQRVRRYLRPTKSGKYKLLSMGGKWDPKAEICDNKKDDTGNGLVDCDDPTCKNKLVCREEIKGKLELFVMSHCPFGIKAMNAMKEVLEAFKDDPLKFELHFIGEMRGGKPSSMHGQSEVDDDIRQLCAIKLYPDNYKFMDYIWCRNENIRDPDWKKCVTKAGLDVAAMEECVKEEGNTLFAEDVKIAQALGFGASPTWLANNKRKFSGLDPETIRKNICQHNPEFTGCSKKLTSTVKGSSGSCR